MTARVYPKISEQSYSQVGPGGLKAQLEKTGKLPPVQIQITPLSGADPFIIDRFLSYQFSSSMIIPVDSFSFNFAAPDDDIPFSQRCMEGDIITLLANGVPISTGIIDKTDIETDNSFGEKAAIYGRDVMGQLEDQDAVSRENAQIWVNQGTIAQSVQALVNNTRIKGIETRNLPDSLATRANLLMATEPGESKLSALQRFLEPLNCLAWVSPNGTIVVGKPNMKQEPTSTLICSKEKRKSNVLSIKVVRESATIPNAIVPIWSGQESVLAAVKKEQVILNRAVGPAKLRQRNHILTKSVTMSNPQGSDAQSLSEVNRLRSAAGSSNLIQAYAKRELARANMKEIIVQVVMAGHYDDTGAPWLVDRADMIEYDRGDVFEKMYLFQVEYVGDESTGQRTVLSYCRVGTIVADNEAT